MKKRLMVLLFILLLVISSYYVIAHEEDEQFALNQSQLYPISQLAFVGYGSLAFTILVVIMLLFHKTMSEQSKKLVFYLVIALVLTVTGYLVITTLHLNITSVTKGPVHWHADYEVWVCDKKLELPHAKGFSNRQGTDLIHAHEDNRIHVEGVLLNKKEASLGTYFHAVGGSLTDDGLRYPTDDGLVAAHDGDICNSKPGKLYVFVNGKLIDNPSDYAISPYETVPPGDMIKIVFTEKSPSEIDPNIKKMMSHKE